MSPARLALGSVQFGMAYGITGLATAVPESEICRILAAASREDVQLIDTAPGYGDIEQRIARLAGDAKFDFVSKIPALPPGLSARETGDFVKQSCARSLKRLGARLRVLLFHRGVDLLEEHADAAWQALELAVRGTAIRPGISAYGPEEVAAVGARFPLQVAQIPGSVFDQRLRVTPGLDGIEIHLRSVFLQGLLLMSRPSAEARVPRAAAALATWEDWCRRCGLSALEAALGAVKSLPGVGCCVIGVDGVEQFEEVAGAWKRATPVAAPDLAVSDPDVIDPRRWTRT